MDQPADDRLSRVFAWIIARRWWIVALYALLLPPAAWQAAQIRQDNSPELLILPVSYKGRSCYRLCWGLYDSEGRAEAAVATVPAYFREGGAKPKAAATATLLP